MVMETRLQMARMLAKENEPVEECIRACRGIGIFILRGLLTRQWFKQRTRGFFVPEPAKHGRPTVSQRNNVA